MVFHTKSGLRRMIFIKHLLHNRSAMYSSEVFYSVNQFIGDENDSREVYKGSASVDMV